MRKGGISRPARRLRIRREPLIDGGEAPARISRAAEIRTHVQSSESISSEIAQGNR